MNALGREFRDWVSSYEVAGATTTVIDDERIAIESDYVTASVSFYCFEDMPEVVELSMAEKPSGETTFFLHFELEDIARAKELFEEMASLVRSAHGSQTTHVLLCCTVGMTTTMFAGRLNDAAKTLSLDYEFEARALEEAKESGGDFAAVLLAPQVGFRRQEVAQAFPNAVVVEIPPKVFGSYDAAGALRMLMGLLGDHSLSSGDPSDLRLLRDIKHDKTLLLIAVINRPKVSTISFRVYEGFRLVAQDKVHKCRIEYRDLVDVVATLHVHGVELKSLDAVGIALPAPVHFGAVTVKTHGFESINIEERLSKKFGITVFVDNNANVGAVGCYMSSDAYDSVTLHTQQVGFLVGGQGTVVNGHLLRGRKGMAGELGAINRRVMLEGGLYLPEMQVVGEEDAESVVRGDVPWRADRMLPILATMLLANITVAAPDAIYINYDLIDDMDVLHDELAKNVPEEFIPDLIHITDYHEKIFAGEMALVLQRLNRAASR